MKNLNKCTIEDFQNGSIHSEICSVSDTDFVYRKAYKGDWGHWDDMPEPAATSMNCSEEESENSIDEDFSSFASHENSYL
ncbi:hypothetical protein [Flavobacterium sp.]|uniref:hypothetical protein n=1 Tax=Flavobacterium sp. TaxID=239 RepID=UPI003265F106